MQILEWMEAALIISTAAFSSLLLLIPGFHIDLWNGLPSRPADNLKRQQLLALLINILTANTYNMLAYRLTHLLAELNLRRKDNG